MTCKICGKWFSTTADSPVCATCDRAAHQFSPKADALRLHDLIQADFEKRVAVLPFAPGSSIYVLERDEDGNAAEVSGYMFLTVCGKWAIVTAYVEKLSTVDAIMQYHTEETAQNYGTDLSVFPVNDCYTLRNEAKAALKKEQEDD